MQRDDIQDPSAMDNGGTYDPAEVLRRRVAAQVAGESSDPTAPASDTSAPAPVDPAPFDAQGQQQPAQQNFTDPTPQAPSPAPEPIPTTANGSQVGSGTPWAPGASAPAGAPAGYTWDPNMASYEPTPGTPATGQQAPTPAGQRPTGGSLTDPSFAAQYVAWAGTQPGVNPSVKNDPNYWIGRFTSGAFGNDQNYALARMMQAEGPPEGAGAPRASTPIGAGTTSLNPGGFHTGTPSLGNGLPQTSQMTAGGLQTPQGLWSPDFIAQLRQILMQRMSGDSATVNPNDPNIAAPLSAAKDQLSRQSDTERNALAERLYAQGGLNTDAVTQGVQQSNERQGTALSSLRANLIVGELNNRRTDLQDAMRLAVQSGDAEMAQNIQLQLSALNAEIQREGIGANLAIAGQQFNQNASNAVTG